MSEKILVPVLGESITEATVSKWLKNKGETVDADEPIVELETDKVNLEVPFPVTGKLIDNVTVGVTTYNDVVFERSTTGGISGFISTSHVLNTTDTVVISGLTTSIPKLTSSHKIGVSSESTVLYKELPANNTAGIVTDIYVANIPNSVIFLISVSII